MVLGVGGSVAAYKSAALARELVRRGAIVRTVLTDAALRFVTPLLFSALTGQEAASELFPGGADGGADHVAWATWAEAGVIAPATADLLGRMAAGVGDDLLTTWLLAFPGPVLVAPAMNRHMWSHPAVQRNVERLRADGVGVLPPGFGPMAAAEGEGWGRLPDPAAVVAALEGLFADGAPTRRPELPPPSAPLLQGRRVVVTAGPTREPIDPVRFISNPSSGRMGYACAEAARDMGASVTLVSGPVAIAPPAGVELVPVMTAVQLRDAALRAAADADLVVFAAAVADWRPAEPSPTKIKKGQAVENTLRLVRNPDASAEVAAAAATGTVLVGFAAEAGAGVAEAERKLRAKGMHLVAFNDVRESGAGFVGATNHVVLVDRDGRREEIGPTSKRAVAERILTRAAALLP